jgi:hypothetical protein
MGRGLDELKDILARGASDPVEALRAVKRAHEIACVLSDAPYSSTMAYLPGCYLPATKIIEVPGIVAVAPGTEADFPVEIQTPGVCVGLMGAVVEANVANSPGIMAGTKYQLNLEQERFFASNGNSNTARASFSMFGGYAATFVPVLIPSRGSGNWIVTIRNDNPVATGPVTAIFNMAFLEGRQYLDLCR